MNPNKNFTADLIVYGGTPAGIITAVAAARKGVNTLIVEQTKHVGGLSTSGLNTSESEHMLMCSFGGIQNEFYRRLGKRYGLDAPLHRWESHVAEDIYEEMLSEAGVAVEREGLIESVATESGWIHSLTTTDGRSFTGKRFVDCSYEGDLAKLAGVTMAWGREPISQYDESLAGMRYINSLEEVANAKGHALAKDDVVHARTVDDQGNLLKGFIPANEIRLGEGDHKTANYNFRVTISRGKDRIPFVKPEGYNPADYNPVVEWLLSLDEPRWNSCVGMLKHPSGTYAIDERGIGMHVEGDKWEVNNHQAAVWSLGYFGAQFDWPDGDHATRQRIWEDHKRHHQGLFYFLSHDERLPQSLRDEAQSWGLAPDEFTDHDNWPYYLYVREARRMVGDYVMTQHDILNNRRKDDVVMLGSHWIDCHHVQRVALDENSFRNEGRIWVAIDQPYDIPYRCLIPKGEQCRNLWVPVAVSASHVGFCSIRLESQWMLLGHVCGNAVAQSLSHDQDAQAIDIKQLQTTLKSEEVQLAV